MWPEVWTVKGRLGLVADWANPAARGRGVPGASRACPKPRPDF